MKKITLLLAVATTFALASDHHDCTYDWVTGTYICPTHIGGTSELATLETFKNDVIDHANQIEFANKGEGAMAVTGALSIGKDIKFVDIVPRYNPTGNIGFDARLPVIQNSDSDKFGIGDISLSGNYHFGNLDSEYGTNITTLRYKASTGSDTDGLGTGEGSITLTHALAKNLDNDLRFHGLLTYAMNMGDIDDAIAAMGGISHTGLIDNVATNSKFTYYMQGDLTVADLWVELSSSKIVDGVPLSTGLKIPLIDSYDGNDLDKYFMLYASFTGFFN
jgi:hypothetical protein